MMEPIALGTDLVEIQRIRSLLERHGQRFLARVYTGEEIAASGSLRDPAPFLAGRFALKEAVLKVLGTGLSGGIRWRDVHVARLPSGAPDVLLEGAALSRAREVGLGRLLVSISHGEDLAVAQALGLRGDPEALDYRRKVGDRSAPLTET
jgi:holo-[acyl-carrier protein] synthase